MDTQQVSEETKAFFAAELGSGARRGPLTESGWPRPRHEGWPVPWISPRDNLSTTDLNRLQACGTGSVCAVCGEGYQEDEKALLLVNTPVGPNGGRFLPGDVIAPDGDGGIITGIDNGVMHVRCARLALAYCPKLRQLLEDDDIVCIEVVAHSATPAFLDIAEADRPVLTATYDSGLVVEMPL